MHALVETSGRQFWVKAGDKVLVDRVSAEPGSELTFDKVLVLRGDDVKVGTPYVEGVTVQARVVEHSLGDKVMTFKYINRRRNRRRRGFRASLTTIEITGISA